MMEVVFELGLALETSCLTMMLNYKSSPEKRRELKICKSKKHKKLVGPVSVFT
jgi:hypothetical protein